MVRLGDSVEANFLDYLCVSFQIFFFKIASYLFKLKIEKQNKICNKMSTNEKIPREKTSGKRPLPDYVQTMTVTGNYLLHQISPIYR